MNNDTISNPTDLQSVKVNFSWKIAFFVIAGLCVLFAALFFLTNWGVDAKVPSIAGKWSYHYQWSDTDFDDDKWMQKIDCDIQGVDIYNDDHTELDIDTTTYTIFIRDANYSGTAVLKYKTTYEGTWEQKDSFIIFNNASSYKWILVESNLYPIPSRTSTRDDIFYLEQCADIIEDDYLSPWSDNKDRDVNKIETVIYDTNTIILEYSDGTKSTMTKLDAHI